MQLDLHLQNSNAAHGLKCELNSSNSIHVIKMKWYKQFHDRDDPKCNMDRQLEGVETQTRVRLVEPTPRLNLEFDSSSQNHGSVLRSTRRAQTSAQTRVRLVEPKPRLVCRPNHTLSHKKMISHNWLSFYDVCPRTVIPGRQTHSW